MGRVRVAASSPIIMARHSLDGPSLAARAGDLERQGGADVRAEHGAVGGVISLDI